MSRVTAETPELDEDQAPEQAALGVLLCASGDRQQHRTVAGSFHAKRRPDLEDDGFRFRLMGERPPALPVLVPRR